MQICTHCGIEITVAIARPEPKMLSGVSSWCRPCHVASARAWRIRNRDAINRQKRSARIANLAKYREAELAAMRRRFPLIQKACSRCAVTFTPTRRNSQRYCTEECQKRNHWQMRSGVPYHLRRKILKRDGWRCYLCTRPIDPALRWPHELSGTVDHVIPWSVCQHNRPDNLRAAHWRCNFDKGDSLPGTEVWVPSEVA